LSQKKISHVSGGFFSGTEEDDGRRQKSIIVITNVMALERSLKQHRRESETESRKTFNIRVCFAFFALSIEQDMELQDVEGRRMDDQSGEAGECTCRSVQGWRVFARRFNAT
jgi:hypothetical protein